MKHHFPIVAVLDESRAQSGTVTIDREAGLLSVRPLRRRREYTLPLDRVASIVVARIVKADLAEKRRAKDKGRKR